MIDYISALRDKPRHRRRDGGHVHVDRALANALHHPGGAKGGRTTAVFKGADIKKALWKELSIAAPDGAILAVPVGDTLKRGSDTNEIETTVDRSGLWAAQTPQLFRVGALAQAIDAAKIAGCELTDEASAMEFAGIRPLLVMGSAANIKITHPSDLAIAEALITRNEHSS